MVEVDNDKIVQGYDNLPTYTFDNAPLYLRLKNDGSYISGMEPKGEISPAQKPNEDTSRGSLPVVASETDADESEDI